MTRLRIVVRCCLYPDGCDLLLTGWAGEPPTRPRPGGLKGEWTRWAELDLLAEAHARTGHATTISTERYATSVPTTTERTA